MFLVYWYLTGLTITLICLYLDTELNWKHKLAAFLEMGIIASLAGPFLLPVAIAVAIETHKDNQRVEDNRFRSILNGDTSNWTRDYSGPNSANNPNRNAQY